MGRPTAALPKVRGPDGEGLEHTSPRPVVVFEREFMTKKISQREAHRLRKKVKELENQLKNDYAGTRITSVIL